jgi:hypothetical protein
MITTDLCGLSVDGPHTEDTIRAAAAGIVTLVRYLNAATTSPACESGPVVADVLADLATASRGLDQTTRQLASAVACLADDSTLYDDRGADHDPADTTESAADATAEARVRLAAVAAALRDAASEAAHLGHRLPANVDHGDG